MCVKTVNVISEISLLGDTFFKLSRESNAVLLINPYTSAPLIYRQLEGLFDDGPTFGRATEQRPDLEVGWRVGCRDDELRRSWNPFKDCANRALHRVFTCQLVVSA